MGFMGNMGFHGDRLVHQTSIPGHSKSIAMGGRMASIHIFICFDVFSGYELGMLLSP
jgi:hypothetical protein